MISPSVSKGNNPPHLADFAAHRDCSAVEAAPAARRVSPAGALGTLRLPRATRTTIGYEQNTSRMPDSVVAADALLRQEPDDDEDEGKEEDEGEEEDGGGGEEDDDDGDDDADDGYSE
jgi:hypothetical protein